MEEEGAARDLGAEGLVVRPLKRTFPFWSIGANLTAAVFLGALATDANITFPFMVIYGNVSDMWGPSGDDKSQSGRLRHFEAHATPGPQRYTTPVLNSVVVP